MFSHSTNMAWFFSVLIAALIFSLSLAGVAWAQGNTSFGTGALQSNTTGSFNTAIGLNALVSNTTGFFNTASGAATDVVSPNLTNATAIGSGAIVNASNKVRRGDALVTVIEGQVAFTFLRTRPRRKTFSRWMEKKCWERFAAWSWRAGTSLATILKNFATMVPWRKTSLRPSATTESDR
jgi:hypothetical protein